MRTLPRSPALPDPSRLRVLPVPVSEPRDVRAATPPPAAGTSGPGTQGALALAAPHEELPAPPARAAPRPRPGRSPHRAVDVRPDPAQTAHGLVLAVVEVLAGTRPSSQLVRWTSPTVHAALVARAAVSTRLRRGAAVPSRRAQVRAVRICPLSDTCVEVGAVVDDGRRVRALALRLEAVDRRWRVSALEIG